MQRFALTIEYDGRPFMGWQHQDHGPSVQRAIENAVHQITGESARVFAAGRTDAGVHALAMRAHVDLATKLSPFRLNEGLNAALRPDPIAILSVEPVGEDWHARHSCVGRRYIYRIVNRRAPLTIERGLRWQCQRALDAKAMHDAAQLLAGRHDFTTFRSAHCQARSPTKTIDRISVRRDGDDVTVEVAARSFLHHQVRSITGCLKLVGEGRWSADDLQAALAARDRRALGLNAPPDGLYFVEAAYP